VRFLLDVNASGPVGEFLQERRHDVRFVAERDIRMSDREILSWAVKESRIIITTDKDFESMVWRENLDHTGIIRLENLPRKERLALLGRILKKYKDSIEEGAILIATQQKVRIRRP
jgi:predicted nuclease of predicted toxin-antitoxin system